MVYFLSLLGGWKSMQARQNPLSVEP